MIPATRFTDPRSVEAWDAWFRWRKGPVLGDVTIDDTWWRVAGAAAAANGEHAPLWAHRYVDAFSHWRLLPDERLLRFAGTAGALRRHVDAPGAVLNVAAFVAASLGRPRRFDRAMFVETAALAVHFLDDVLVGGQDFPADQGLRIGIIGLGTALARLGLPYASAEARDQARTIAVALAEGCLRGAVDLAEERGGADVPQAFLRRHLRQRETPSCLLERACRQGVRHVLQTALERHPQLARLANDTSDCIDPAAAEDPDGVPDLLRTARNDLLTAMQPWIDRSCSDAVAVPRRIDDATTQAVAAGA